MNVRALLCTTTAALVALFAPPQTALACSNCGCTLSSDWASQGYSGGEGAHFDFRFDYFSQNQLRSGTSSVDRGSQEITNESEVQQTTINRNYTFNLVYSLDAD